MNFIGFKGGKEGVGVWISPDAVTIVRPTIGEVGLTDICTLDGHVEAVQGDPAEIVTKLRASHD